MLVKDYFRGLIGRLKETGKWVLISGPLPRIGHGMECFSHLFCLKCYNFSMDLEYIHNFDHFCEKPQF
jgi:hypothetical protein